MDLTLSMNRLPPRKIPMDLNSRQGPVQSCSRIDGTFISQVAPGLLLTDVHDNTPAGPRSVYSGVFICVEGVVID